MNKSLLQKRFRFVMIIAALALFITIVTPTYIIYKKNSAGFPKVIWMWTVLFGAGESKLSTLFNFSWLAFIGYAMALVILIISLARKFISVDAEDKKGKGGVVVDAICSMCALIALVMFIILPFSLTNGLSTTDAGAIALTNFYGWGISFILAYIILSVMLVSSLIVVYAEAILKIKSIKDRKANSSETNKE